MALIAWVSSVDLIKLYSQFLDFRIHCDIFPLLGDLIDVGHDFYLFLAHPELLGLRTTQLPASVTYTYDNESPETTSFSYELDKQGYISKITIKEEDFEPYTYTLTWE